MPRNSTFVWASRCSLMHLCLLASVEKIDITNRYLIQLRLLFNINPGVTPIFLGTLCKALKTPFLCSLLVKLPLKSLLCHPKIPRVLSFWSKVTNLSHNDPNVLDLFWGKTITNSFKIYENYHKCPSELVTKHILLGILRKTHCVCVFKSHFSPVDPSF